MGTKNNPGPTDCYNKAEADEPLFVLLGRDRHAPALIWLWSSMRELDGEDPAVVKEARDCADAMCKYAAEHGRSSAGLGYALLISAFDMIRTCNFLRDYAPAAQSPVNKPTSMDDIVKLLTHPSVWGAENRDIGISIEYSASLSTVLVHFNTKDGRRATFPVHDIIHEFGTSHDYEVMDQWMIEQAQASAAKKP